MRQMEFKMERLGLLEVGQRLPVKEFALPNSYYYVLGSAYAMSGNYTTLQRLKSTEGLVSDVRETPRGYYVTVDFDEEDIDPV